MSSSSDVLLKEGVHFNLFPNWKRAAEAKKLGEILIFTGL